MYSKMRSLRVGQKYTHAGFTYTGLPYHAQMILKDIKCIGFEHGHDTYEIIYRKVGSKAICHMKFDVTKQFIIWDGLVNPDTQLAVAAFIKDGTHGAVQMLKKWRSNDPRYMHRAALSITQEPIVFNYKSLLDASSKMFDLCEVIS